MTTLALILAVVAVGGVIWCAARRSVELAVAFALLAFLLLLQAGLIR